MGLKPGLNRVRLDDGGWGGIANEFLLTRSVRDARLFLDVVGDGAYTRTPPPWRIAVDISHWAGMPEDPDVVRVATQAADALRALGHEIVEIAAPLDYQQLMSTFGPLFHRWLVHDVDALVASGRVADETTLEPFTLLALDHLRRLTMTDIAAAQITAGEITVRLERELQMFDALLTPTLGRSSIPLREMAGDVTDMDRYIELTDEYFPNSWLFNVTGWPSLSVPFGASGDASMPMPIGVQLSAPIGSEHVLLDMAEQLLT